MSPVFLLASGSNRARQSTALEPIAMQFLDILIIGIFLYFDFQKHCMKEVVYLDD